MKAAASRKVATHAARGGASGSPAARRPQAGNRIHRSGTRPRQGGKATGARGGRHRGKRSPLRVVTPRARRLPFLIASFLIVGALVVGVASVQAVVSQGSFRMQELTRRNLELEQEYGRLKLRVAELSAPGRIAAEARRRGFRVAGDVRALPVKGTVPVSSVAGTAEQPVLSLKGLLEQEP